MDKLEEKDKLHGQFHAGPLGVGTGGKTDTHERPALYLANAGRAGPFMVLHLELGVGLARYACGGPCLTFAEEEAGMEEIEGEHGEDDHGRVEDVCGFVVSRRWRGERGETY